MKRFAIVLSGVLSVMACRAEVPEVFAGLLPKDQPTKAEIVESYPEAAGSDREVNNKQVPKIGTDGSNFPDWKINFQEVELQLKERTPGEWSIMTDGSGKAFAISTMRYLAKDDVFQSPNGKLTRIADINALAQINLGAWTGRAWMFEEETELGKTREIFALGFQADGKHGLLVYRIQETSTKGTKLCDKRLMLRFKLTPSGSKQAAKNLLATKNATWQPADKPSIIHVGYDPKVKKTYVNGDAMIQNGKLTAFNRQVVLFDESFKTSKASYTVHGTIIRSDGQNAMVDGQKILGIFYDGKSLTPLKNEDAVRLAQSGAIVKIQAPKTTTEASLPATTESGFDAAKRYRWEKQSPVPLSGKNFIVKDTKNGQTVEMLKDGSIPYVVNKTVIDLPGSINIHIEIDPAAGKTTYAGLSFTTPCVIDILKDGTVVTHQAGISAKDRDGTNWASKSATLGDNKVNAFFITSATQKTLEPHVQPSFSSGPLLTERDKQTIEKAPSVGLASGNARQKEREEQIPAADDKPTALTLAGNNSNVYDTQLGKLEEEMSIEQGAEISFLGSGNIEIIFGFARMSSTSAMSVGSELTVITGRQVTDKPQVTLVQDKATGKWLATNGKLAVAKQKTGVVEGHTIRILGGKNHPIKINGLPFADTTVVITNGKPVPQKKR